MALKFNPVTGKVEDDGNRQVPVADDAIQRLTTGVLGLPVALGRDLVNQVGTRVSNAGRGLIGAEPAPLPGLQRTSELAGVVGAAAQDFGQMNSNLAASVRSGLGLSAAGLPTPEPEGPIVPPMPAPPADAVLTQPSAPQAVQAPAPVAQAAPVPRAMEPVPTEVQSVQQLDVRPPPQNSGLTFGFGGGNETARQYLDRMDAADQRDRTQRQQNNINAQIGFALKDLSRDGATIGEQYAARQQLAALQPLALGLSQGDNNLAVQGLSDRAALQRTQLEADANANDTALQAQTQLGVAGIGAEATLGAAGTTANATQQAKLLELQLEQVSPKTQLATTRNRIESARLRLAEQAEASGDAAGAARILAGGAAPGEKPVLDMFQNLIGFRDNAGNVRRLDDAKIAELRAASLLQQGLQ